MFPAGYFKMLCALYFVISTILRIQSLELYGMHFKFLSVQQEVLGMVHTCGQTVPDKEPRHRNQLLCGHRAREQTKSPVCQSGFGNTRIYFSGKEFCQCMHIRIDFQHAFSLKAVSLASSFHPHKWSCFLLSPQLTTLVSSTFLLEFCHLNISLPITIFLQKSFSTEISSVCLFVLQFMQHKQEY